MMLFRLVKVVNEGRAMYASIMEKTSGTSVVPDLPKLRFLALLISESRACLSKPL
jgi:hypothetical protein